MKRNFDLIAFTKKIFEELTYENVSFSFVDKDDRVLDESILFKNIFKNNYYLLLFVNNVTELNLILDKQSHYFFLLKEFFYELQEIDKNTSMIIFLHSTEHNNEMLVVEEDPYYFKKYVLPYTDEQFKSLSKDYSDKFNEFGVVRTLNEIISDVDLFEEFKSSPDDLSNFNLVSKFFVKIPILKMPINIDKDIYLLENSIDSALRDKDLFTIKSQIDLQLASKDTVQGDEEENMKIIKSLMDLYKEKED